MLKSCTDSKEETCKQLIGEDNKIAEPTMASSSRVISMGRQSVALAA
jgi:hypothetical protein